MKKLCNLTNPQKSIWVTEEFYKGTSINIIAGTAMIADKVDFAKLKEAINIFVKTNDSFRLKLIKNNSEIQQFVENFAPLSFETVNVETEEDVKNIEDELSKTPLELFDSYLFNVKFFKFKDGHGGFVIAMHHLIVDAWAGGLFISRVIDIYDALLNDEFTLEKFTTPSYIDYLESEQKYLESSKFEKDKTFWNNMFTTVPENVTFPSTAKDTGISSTAKRKLFNIPSNTMSLITSFCKEHKISPFNFFMGIYGLYLSRVSNLDEFVIGTPILNRSNSKEKHTIGMFISVVPFKISINHEKSFADFSSEISADFFNIFRHQKYPYQTLLEDLRRTHGSIPNLYNIMFSYQNMRNNKQSTKTNYEATWLFNGNTSEDIEIHFFDVNDTGIINVAYDYKTSKYNTSDIEAIHSRILHIVNQIIENNDILLKEIEIVTPEEKNKILNEFNNTKMDYPKDKTIVQLFEEQVEKAPENVAVVFEGKTLTYKELNEKANQLANYLISKGLDKETNIGIFTTRSFDSIIAILAVLKLNCTYVPIDPEYPKDRIEHMINIAKINFILYSGPCAIDESYNISLIDINSSIYSNFDTKTHHKFAYNSENNLYVIFTSGSTGKPKGVCLTHKNMVNLIYFEIFKTNIFKNPCNILQFATMSFDVSYQEIFSALLTGNRLYLVSDNMRKNTHSLVDYISQNKINTLFLPPAYLKLLCSNAILVEKIKLFVKNIITAGEKLVLTPGIQELINSGIVIHNHYGPAETHVATAFTIDSLNLGTEPPIGIPVSNTQIYILDKNHQLCPNNVIGQICIAGDCVGNGYINNQTLTNSRFIKNKFTNSMMYLTGDLGYFSPEGLLYFIGRNDFQIKINGFRIELEEVETALQTYPNITNCLVVPTRLKQTGQSLVAYYTANKTLSVSDIKKYLSIKIPNYMIPSYFMQLEKIPCTVNGKIDRKNLPLPNINSEKNIISPRNSIDTYIVDLLTKILNISTISIDDNFFELGGDSLSAINLCTHVQSEFNVQLFVKDILEHPIVQEISDIISDNINIEKAGTITPVEKQAYYPVSSAQKRIYFASTMSGENSILYNIAGGIILDGAIDTIKLEKCFNKIIKRHETLRTYFVFENDNVVQKIKDKIDFKLDIQENIDFSNLNVLFKDFVKPFNLAQAPLFRAKFVKFTNSKTALFIDMHHIISDGTSLSVFIEELCKLYNDETLPELNITYKDFSVFENNRISSGELEEAEKYWVNQFENDIPVLNLPTNYPRPAVQTFEGAKVYSTIDLVTANKINSISKELGITPYMFLLSAYYILLEKYTSQDDIVVGSPIVGRDIAETYNLIGMFVNTLALRTKIDSNLTFLEFINVVKTNCLNAYKYQTYPFDELVNKLNIKRDSSRSPLFDTMFTYQNNGLKSVQLNNINSEYYIPETSIAKFDLSLELIPNNNGISVSFEYATKLFNKNFIENLSCHYLNIINAILENNEIKLADICMLSQNEKNKILKEFNDTKLDYQKDTTVVQLFEQQVEKEPDNIAVIFEGEKLTYRELNAKANSIAHFLKQNDIGKNDIVPVYMSRSLDLIISMLGIIKAGAAYLPISVEMPSERIDFILKNSKSKIAFVKTTQNLIYNDSINIIDLEQFDYSKYSTKNISMEIKPSDLLYVIYTSGSTGNPKGVKVTHHNLVNFVKSFNEQYSNITCEDKLLASTNISFDVSIFEFFITLLNGAKLYLYDEPNITDIFKYCKTIVKDKITFLYIPPNILEDVYSILSTYSNIPINKMLLGVEPIKTSTIKKYYSLNSNMKIINAYGPTEATVCSTSICLNNDILKKYKIIPIGKPLHNLQIYILDKNKQPVPIGVPGEIYISGDNISKGYLNNKDLTAQNFVSIPNLNCSLAYKTGDLAKWNDDGLISFIGRNDFQVKVNGHRIELGEIESCIYQYPNIDKNIVMLDKNNKLICYFSSSKQINISDLKAFMQRKLPLYFIPNFFVQVEKFKLTSNGKIDRKSLAKIKIDTQSTFEEPQTEYQKSLVNAFETVLGIDKVGITDNFFELGGDSLLAIKLQIEAFNNGLNIAYQDIFKYPTVRLLSENILSDKTKKDDLNDEYDYSEINKLLKNNVFDNKKKLTKNKFKNVLLTGATGFLGSHILDSLLKNTKSNVYCLIREKNNNDPQIRLLNTLRFYFGNKYDRQIFNRIIVIEGDIKEEQLGLNDLYYEELGRTIDCVINSAAIVKHYGNIDAFNKTNIQGAKNIVRFCSDYNCKLYHLSTLSVSGNIFETDSYKVAELSSDINFNEQSLYIGQDLSNVYIYTKFIAERLILENIINGKIEAKIIRLGNITNRYSDGIFQINVSENAFLNRMNSFLHIGCIPDYLADRYMEFSPVDLCAESIVKLVFYNTNSTVYHIYNNNHITFRELISILNSLKIDIKIVDRDTFNRKINTLSKNEISKNALSGIINDFDENKNLVYNTNIKLQNNYTNKILKHLLFKWPKINERYLKKYIIYLKSIGYIK